MKTLLSLGAFGALALLGASAAQAATSPEATVICRVAGPGDHANATMTETSQALVCKPLAMSMKTSDGHLHVIGTVSAKSAPSGPDLSHALTAAQIDDAWVRYLESQFRIDHSP